MVITAGPAGAAHDRTINNGPAPRSQQEPIMTFFKNQVRNVTLALAFAASISAFSSTSSFAFSAEAQQMCTGDAFRLCSSEIPNIPKITACMVKHRGELSTGCRSVMDHDMAAQKSSKVAAD